MQDAALKAKELPSDQTSEGRNMVSPTWMPVGTPTINSVVDAATPAPLMPEKATDDDDFGDW